MRRWQGPLLEDKDADPRHLEGFFDSQRKERPPGQLVQRNKPLKRENRREQKARARRHKDIKVVTCSSFKNIYSNTLYVRESSYYKTNNSFL